MPTLYSLLPRHSGLLMRIAIAMTVVVGMVFPVRADDVAFENSVRPILKAHCWHCHGEDTDLKGKLDARLVRLLTKGGEEAYLRQFAMQENVASFVTFVPVQSKESLRALYHQSDVFLFTSIWPEPFGRVIVEAMASGLTVVGAPVGGAAEILSANENALTFTPDDPSSLAQQLRRLIETPALRERLAKAGRETAIRQFDLQRMTNEIEAYVQALI